MKSKCHGRRQLSHRRKRWEKHVKLISSSFSDAAPLISYMFEQFSIWNLFSFEFHIFVSDLHIADAMANTYSVNNNIHICNASRDKKKFKWCEMLDLSLKLTELNVLYTQWLYEQSKVSSRIRMYLKFKVLIIT